MSVADHTKIKTTQLDNNEDSQTSLLDKISLLVSNKKIMLTIQVTK